jgi:hypothetical protein
MADIGQATFDGGDILIKCDGKWTCCQRQQAAAKVRAMNKELPKNVRKIVSAALNDRKEAAQEDARDAMDDAATPAERAAAAKAAGAAPCVVEALAKGKSRSKLKLEMDHPLDVKLGGAADGVALIPLNRTINGFFGGVARNAGNEMRDVNDSVKVESVSLICPPSKPGCPPPGDPDGHSHNAGPRRAYPDSPGWLTPKRAAA